MATPTRKLATDVLVGRTLGGRLTIKDRIGAGALGVVYRAKHMHLPQPIAVKVLHAHFQANESFRSRFQTEARAASLLDHPNLVRVLDFGEEPEGLLWLAMDLLDGATLADILDAAGRVTVARAAEIMLQVCAGLAHAHARGVIHGDVKPSNVLLVKRPDDDGEEMDCVKLCDFGVARASPTVDPDASGEHPIIGTPEYMSPEQCLGEPLDARSDVYSCGILFYELVTGVAPFTSDEPQSLLRQHLLESPAKPSAKIKDIDPRVDAIALRALEKEREDRFGSMREMRAALRELIGPNAHPSTIPPPPGTPRAPHISEVRERDEAKEFSAAHTFVGDPEKDAFADLLANGSIDAIAARVARISARVEASKGRDRKALGTLALLDDPELLQPFAHRLLSEDVMPSPYLERMLVRSGKAIARALWSARVTHHGTRERRARFVAWLTAVGPAARDVLRAGLNKLVPHAETGKHADMIEDVLLSLPMRCDDDIAELVAVFARSPNARVRELAIATLARAL
jgi:eukaryotic-like serine/threonine-protein kinase